MTPDPSADPSSTESSSTEPSSAASRSTGSHADPARPTGGRAARRFTPAVITIAAAALATGGITLLPPKDFTAVADLSTRAQGGHALAVCPGPLTASTSTVNTGDEELAASGPSTAATLRTLAVEPEATMLFGRAQAAQTMRTETGELKTPNVRTESVDGVDAGGKSAAGTAAFAVLSSPVAAGGLQTRSVSADSLRPIADTVQVARTDSGDYRSLALTRCGTPRVSGSFTGVSTRPGSSSALMLTNTTDRPATAQLTLHTPTGRADTGTRTDVVVAPGSTETVLLESLVPDSDSVGVTVTVQGAPLTMSLQTAERTGLTPGGAEILTPQAEPAAEHRIPGAVVSEGHGLRTSLLNPSGHTAQARVRVVDARGTVASDENVSIPASGTVEAVPQGLAPGRYAVMIDADTPVVAAVRSSTAGTPGADGAAAPVDFTLVPSAEVITNSSVLALPAGGDGGVLDLTSDTDTAVTVMGTLSDGTLSEPVTVEVPKDSAVNIPASRITSKPGALTGLVVVPEDSGSLSGVWSQALPAGSTGPVISSVPLLDNNLDAAGTKVNLHY